MRRLPLIASFLLFIALCASAAYWAMQLFKPPLRPVAAPPRAAQAEMRPEAAAMLFGGRKGNGAVASNYQLRGVIFSGNPRDSVAILSADGKPAQAIRVDAEVVPGVTVKEVHRDYVLLSEDGATKRVELPEDAKGQNGITAWAPDRPGASVPPAPGAAIPSRAEAAAAAQTPPPAAPPITQPLPPVQPVPSAPSTTVPTPQQPVPGQAPQAPVTAPPVMGVSPPPGVQPGAPTAPVPPQNGVPQATPPAMAPGMPQTPAR